MPGLHFRKHLKRRGHEIRFVAIVTWEGVDDLEMNSRFALSMAESIAKTRALDDLDTALPENPTDSDYSTLLENKNAIIAKQAPVGIDSQSLQNYYLVDQRTTILIGKANSAMDLQKFSSSFSHGFNANVDISLALEGFELYELLK